MCTETAVAGASFWSNASSAPFTWSDLVTDLELGNLLIEATGR
jgi:hypothetical protein